MALQWKNGQAGPWNTKQTAVDAERQLSDWKENDKFYSSCNKKGASGITTLTDEDRQQ